MSEESGRDQQPRNMRGLLQMAVSVQNTQDSQEEQASFSAMSEERREWLSNALEGLTTDIVQEMSKAIDVLRQSLTHQDRDDIEEQEAALDIILEQVDSIDNANDFEKLGGFEVLLQLFNSPHDSIRWRAAFLVGELVQNNPYCQNAALSNNMLHHILLQLDKDENELSRVKSLYAVSCIIRNCPAAQEQFMSEDGLSILVRAMQSGVEKLRMKSAFVLSNVANQNPAYKDVMTDMGYVEQLVGLLRQGHDPSHEFLLGCLLSLCEGEDSNQMSKAIHECQRPELHLYALLQSRSMLLTGKFEFQEERNYCHRLLELVFPENMTGER